MPKGKIIFGSFLCLMLLVSSCRKDAIEEDVLMAEEGEAFSAGPGTVFNQGPDAFGFEINALEGDEELQFFVGNSFFKQNWVQAPSSTTARDGLGPFFNSRTCSGCHFKDGRGRPPVSADEFASGLLFRVTRPGQNEFGANIATSHYGNQLQDRAIDGLVPEGSVNISYQTLSGQFADGTTYTLKKPIYMLQDLAYGPMESDAKISPRVANQMIGLGFLEAITEEQLLDWSDPNDVDGDGISGRPNYVWNEVTNSTTVGLFGWKANQPSLLQQTAAAFNGDMGITTSIFPEENCAEGQQACADAPSGGTPEIEDDDLDKVLLYVASLAVPARRSVDDLGVLRGKQIFNQIGCNKCHLPKVVTGQHPTKSYFSHQTIRPYTDMLLHDMGPDLADGIGDFEATGTEWRTPPLWGIGLIETVNGHTRFLHDGRAENILEAVLWHGGEAQSAKEQVEALSASDRDNLVKFLNSL